MERFRGWAMRLTLMRVYLIPLFIITYYFHPESWNQWLAVAVYFIASISDFFDGYLARTLKEESAFGAFLDPVADKLMVTIVLVVLIQAHPEMWLMFCAMIIIGREIWISALREWLSGLGHSKVVAVSNVGKWKTTFQMFALGFLIYWDNLWIFPIKLIGQTLLIIATILTLYSMVQYTQAGLKFLKG